MHSHCLGNLFRVGGERSQGFIYNDHGKSIMSGNNGSKNEYFVLVI
jgi:hypothetical protein